MREVLIIDDNQSSSELKRFLGNTGFSVIIVDTVEDGMGILSGSEDVKVVLLSVALSSTDGLEALGRIRDQHPEVIVIVIRAGIQTIRRATRLGALKVLLSPLQMAELHEALDRAFVRLSNRSNTFSTPEGETLQEQPALVGKSTLMRELNRKIGLAASFNASVLIEGETGTGKGVVARLIHRLIHEGDEGDEGDEENERAEAPFIPFDCGAVVDTLRGSELFGHEKGAFTDAISDRPGAFEMADGGTLFLDEIGNMTPALQGTLLNVLQEREFRRVGGNRARSVDVRVISATNQKLEEMIEGSEFRRDLYYRLCDYKISVPSLRDRIEDIPLLTTHFLQRIEKENQRPTISISEEVIALLQAYSWPGNVRELYNCLKQAAMNSQGDVILPKDLPQVMQMVRRDEGSDGGVPNIRSSETPETPRYRNLLDLPTAVFCQFISDARSDGIESQIALWWEEFSNDGRDRAYRAEREINDWELDWSGPDFSFIDLSERITRVIGDAISPLSNLRHRIDSEPVEETEPVSIIGNTLKGSLTAILHEIVKEHAGNKGKAAKELRISLAQLGNYLSYCTEDDGNDTNNSLQTSIQPSRRLERFPIDETIRLLTEPIKHFIWENFSRAEWRNKNLNGQIRTVHLALRVLSKRLAGDHGCPYFGGMTFPRIEWNIHCRAPYLYANHAEVAEALNVDIRTFKKYWPENKPFPSHYTLFTG